MISNKIQVVYRLPNRVTLMWPVRPNESTVQAPSSYNVYWDTASGGTFVNLLTNVTNAYQNNFGSRTYHNKVVVNLVPSQIPGWVNDATNYVRLKAIVGGVEQAFEGVIAIPPYTTNGMRLQYPELRTAAIVGYNTGEQRFIPVSVDTTGKVITTT